MSEDTAARLSEALRDRYAIEGEIDRGGMAVVYLAQDLKHGRKVAVKILNPSLSAVLRSVSYGGWTVERSSDLWLQAPLALP